MLIVHVIDKALVFRDLRNSYARQNKPLIQQIKRWTKILKKKLTEEECQETIVISYYKRIPNNDWRNGIKTTKHDFKKTQQY